MQFLNALCGFLCITGLDVHLLQTQIYCCKAQKEKVTFPYILSDIQNTENHLEQKLYILKSSVKSYTGPTQFKLNLPKSV